MSIEKAKAFQEFPQLIIRLIEFEIKKTIVMKNIYFRRSDKNLRMSVVVLFVEYETISQ